MPWTPWNDKKKKTSQNLDQDLHQDLDQNHNQTAQEVKKWDS